MKEIDARRLLCPMPVIRLQEAACQMPPGEEIKMICTDPGVMSDIPAWCKVHGHRVVQAEETHGEYHLVVRLQ
ncbi:MAG TPA: SirA family protein [Gammaproteobacteria bacterium]|nr:SirA family protein [Gammaproteobacteria bacterium]